jgi:hypothetical protein
VKNSKWWGAASALSRCFYDSWRALLLHNTFYCQEVFLLVITLSIRRLFVMT